MNEKKENSHILYTKEHYLKNIKRIINLIKLHRKAGEEKDKEKMAYVEYKLKQMDSNFVCKKLHAKKYKELIHSYLSQIKVINYIEKETFISLDFENVGLTYDEISKACIILESKGILKRRNCTGIAYEFNK